MDSESGTLKWVLKAVAKRQKLARTTPKTQISQDKDENKAGLALGDFLGHFIFSYEVGECREVEVIRASGSTEVGSEAEDLERKHRVDALRKKWRADQDSGLLPSPRPKPPRRRRPITP